MVRTCRNSPNKDEVFMNATESTWFQPALHQLVEAVNAGQSTRTLVARATTEGATVGVPGEIIGCFASAALQLIHGLRKDGVTFNALSKDANIIEMDPMSAGLKITRQIAERDLPGLGASLRGLCAGLDACSQKGIRFSLGTKAAESAAPLKVVVVEMPARKTETTVTRDDAGNIIGSVQTEEDAA
jgi:hypothetical protein